MTHFVMRSSDQPVRISACEKRGSARRTLGLDVVLFEDDARPRQLVEVGSLHSWVVPGNVIIAEVISQDQQNVGSFGALLGS